MTANPRDIAPAVVRRAYLDSRWGQTHVRISGARGLGPPLLLLHPTPKSGWIYETLMGRLGHRCFAIAPDTPGYGASDPPARPASIEDLAVAIMEAVTPLAPEGPVDVMGYHTGSVLAVALSRLYPERVGRLVLTSLPAYDAPTRAAKLEGLSSWPAPEIEGGHLGRLWSIMRARTHPALGVDWLHASFAENLRPGRRGPWGYAAVYGYDLIAALPLIGRPTLVLNPEDDLHAVTAAHAALIPGAAYMELPGARHGVFEHQAAEVAEIVTGFLASADRPETQSHPR